MRSSKARFYIYFVSRHQYYNGALGTMYYETIGSFLIFAVAFGAVISKRVSSALMAAFWMLSLAGALYVSVYYAAFICGLGLTLLFSCRKIMLPRSGSIALIVLAVLLLSFVSPTGEYAALARLGVKAEWSPYSSVVGAAFLIVGVEASESIRQGLSGRIGVFLGKLSFPIYLVHFLVLASLGCFVWLRVNRVYGPDVALIVAFVTSVSVAVVASLPFMVFDRWWTFNVNRIAEFVVKKRHGEVPQVEAALPC